MWIKLFLLKKSLTAAIRYYLFPAPDALKYFYDCCPVSWDPDLDLQSPVAPSYKHLFDSLAISNAGQEYLDKMGKYPVIFLSFKGSKEKTWESCWNKIKQLIQDEFLVHDYLLNSPVIKSAEKTYFKKIIDLTGDIVDYENSLAKLLIFLSRHYNKRAVSCQFVQFVGLFSFIL